MQASGAGRPSALQVQRLTLSLTAQAIPAPGRRVMENMQAMEHQDQLPAIKTFPFLHSRAGAWQQRT